MRAISSLILANLSFLCLEAMEIYSPLIVHLCAAHCDMRGVSGVSFSEKYCFSRVFIFNMVVGLVRKELSSHQIGCHVLLPGNVKVMEIRLWSERTIG